MKRFRKDLGDLEPLKQSIKELGLIHAIIIDSKGELIAGERRLKACEELGIKPEYRIIDFDNPIKAELHENTIRKDFTPSEIHAISQYLNEQESKQGNRTDINFVTNDNEVKPIEKVSELTGKGTATISKINQIFESDFENIQEQVDKGELSIDSGYKEIKKQEKEKNRNAEIETQKEKIENDIINKPDGLYDIIIIDPPWKYNRKYNPDVSRIASPYPEMDFDELGKMILPANENCILWLWTTHAFIWDAKKLMEMWGFEYKAILTWDKERMGIGYWLRMQCEFCLLGIKGKPIWDIKNIRDIIREPKREHSRKPEIFYDMIKDDFVGRKLDYFAREKRNGFDCFGNDINKF